MEKEAEDPIDRIRRVRHEISRKFDHDPHKLLLHYMELQERHADRLIKSPGPSGEARKTA